MTHNPEAQDKKLVAWHTEAYNLISTDTCLICLTRQEVYLLGQALNQMRWTTRWQVGEGDTLPDIDAIASELEFKLTDCIDFCAEIVTCIETNPETRDAIQNALSGYPDVNGDSIRWLTDAIETVPACDQDTTYGYVVALWKFINQNNKDFLQIMAEATNTAEQLGGLVSAIPIFNQLPVDEILDWVGRFGDYNLEAYNASITIAINEQIECDLFCIAVSNGCTLTFQDVWDYMLAEFGGVTFPTLGATFLELVDFMISGSYDSDRIVYLWSLMQLGTVFIGAEFVGINTMNTYAVHAKAGDSSNDWTLLCDPCGWSQSWLGGNGDIVASGWVYEDGAYDVGDDDIDGTPFSVSFLVRVNYTFTAQTTITRIFHDGTMVRVSGSDRTMRTKWFDDSTSTWTDLATVRPTVMGTNPYTLNWTGSQVFDVGDILQVLCAVSNDPDPGNSIEMDHLTVEGEGINPF